MMVFRIKVDDETVVEVPVADVHLLWRSHGMAEATVDLKREQIDLIQRILLATSFRNGATIRSSFPPVDIDHHDARSKMAERAGVPVALPCPGWDTPAVLQRVDLTGDGEVTASYIMQRPRTQPKGGE